MSARDLALSSRKILAAGILGVAEGAAESVIWVLDLETGGRLFHVDLGDGEETLGCAEARIAQRLSADAAEVFEDVEQPRRLGDAFATIPLIVLAHALQSDAALRAAVRRRLGVSEARPQVFLRSDGTANAALGVVVSPEPDGAAIAETLKRRCSLILQQLDGSDKRLRQVSVLFEDEHRTLVVEPNRTVKPYPAGKSVGALFRCCADRFPEAEALRFGETSLTYRELNARAARVAGALRARGVRPDDTVGVFADRSAAAVISILGVVLAGAVYVPLSPRWPRARQQKIERHAGLALVIDCTNAAPAPEVSCPCLPADGASADGRPFDGDDGRCGTDRLHILFTSGSTGEPKGVEILHRGVTKLVCDRDLNPCAPGTTVMHGAPLTFDVSTQEIWLPLLNGGVLWGFDTQEVLTPESFLRARRGRRLDIAAFTAALFEALLKQNPAALAGIGRLNIGGESLRPATVAAALATAGLGTLVHCYGPTETTVCALSKILCRDDTVRDAVPLGRPTANTTVYVLDRHLRPTPPDADGEIFIGGDGVARGYLGDPERTAAAFVPDVVSGRDGTLYRTGDRARIRPDGLIVFAGRRDNQVKISGHRIELGEIEAALQTLPGVDRAVVRVHAPSDGDRRLLAWVKPAQPQADDPAAFTREIERRSRALLPPYMVPAWVVAVTRFPLTAHGKLDTSALPKPTAETTAPVDIDRNDPLPGVLALFRTRLVNPALTPDQSFLESGGNSLLAVRIAQEIRSLCGLAPPISLFFEPDTPGLVSDFLQAAFWSQDAKQHVPHPAAAMTRI